mmetsp:Transcript_56153/g.162680  ORF Transcript_56153/g.162680 Transcript_56153/m.162680 type:complete len:249 (+) Transcript_56153:185-931(+)
MIRGAGRRAIGDDSLEALDVAVVEPRQQPQLLAPHMGDHPVDELVLVRRTCGQQDDGLGNRLHGDLASAWRRAHVQILQKRQRELAHAGHKPLRIHPGDAKRNAGVQRHDGEKQHPPIVPVPAAERLAATPGQHLPVGDVLRWILGRGVPQLLEIRHLPEKQRFHPQHHRLLARVGRVLRAALLTYPRAVGALLRRKAGTTVSHTRELCGRVPGLATGADAIKVLHSADLHMPQAPGVHGEVPAEVAV